MTTGRINQVAIHKFPRRKATSTKKPTSLWGKVLVGRKATSTKKPTLLPPVGVSNKKPHLVPSVTERRDVGMPKKTLHGFSRLVGHVPGKTVDVTAAEALRPC